MRVVLHSAQGAESVWHYAGTASTLLRLQCRC